jgi:hypothetical protein
VGGPYEDLGETFLVEEVEALHADRAGGKRVPQQLVVDPDGEEHGLHRQPEAQDVRNQANPGSIGQHAGRDQQVRSRRRHPDHRLGPSRRLTHDLEARVAVERVGHGRPHRDRV